MNCYYCDQIVASDPAYPARPTEFDTGSEAPRVRPLQRLAYSYVLNFVKLGR